MQRVGGEDDKNASDLWLFVEVLSAVGWTESKCLMMQFSKL